MKSRKNVSESGFTLIEVIITLVVVAVVAAMMTAYFGKGITQSSIPIFRLDAAGKLNEIMEIITAHYGQYPQWQKNTTYAANAVILPTIPKRTGLLYRTTSGGTSGTNEPDWSLPPTRLESGSTIIDNTVTWTLVWPTATPPNIAAPTLALIDRRAGTVYSLNTIVYPGNGYQYICTVAGTSSGGTVTWPPGNSATVSDGTVTWKQIGAQPTLVLQRDINTNSTTTVFGRNYSVIHNKFIKFDTNVSPATEVDLTSDPTNTDYGKYLKVTIGLHSNEANRTDETLTTLFVRR